MASDLEASANAGDLTGADEMHDGLRSRLAASKDTFRERAAETSKDGNTLMKPAAKQAGGNGHIRPSLLIADDDPVVRSALRAQLATGFDVVAVAENATGAIELAAQYRPDVALVDVDMPFGGALAAVPQIARRSPDTCIVILSGDETPRVVLELIEAGAIAYIRKGATGAQISKTLTEALDAHADPAGSVSAMPKEGLEPPNRGLWFASDSGSDIAEPEARSEATRVPGRATSAETTTSSSPGRTSEP